MLSKKWLKIVMGRYAAEISVIDWKIFITITSKPCQHHHLVFIKRCNDILGCGQQCWGAEKVEHRILYWFSKHYPFI